MSDTARAPTGNPAVQIAAPPAGAGLSGWLPAPAYSVSVAAVLAMALIDLAWNQQAGLSFTGWLRPVTAVALLGLLGLVYSAWRPRPRIAELAIFAALWIALSVFGALQTYLAAAVSKPLMDDAFVRIDAALGFDWVAWVEAVRAAPVLNVVLRLAYDSLLPQILGSLLLFSFASVEGRNAELLLTAALALLITSGVAALLPAVGPWIHFGTGALKPSDTLYVAHTLALRQGQPPPFALAEMQGIVCLPSYHTALALIFVHAHRGLRWSFPPVAGLNALMLLSIPSEGGHYLIDMLAGAAVALAAVLIIRPLGPVLARKVT